MVAHPNLSILEACKYRRNDHGKEGSDVLSQGDRSRGETDKATVAGVHGISGCKHAAQLIDDAGDAGSVRRQNLLLQLEGRSLPSLVACKSAMTVVVLKCYSHFVIETFEDVSD